MTKDELLAVLNQRLSHAHLSSYEKSAVSVALKEAYDSGYEARHAEITALRNVAEWTRRIYDLCGNWQTNYALGYDGFGLLKTAIAELDALRKQTETKDADK